MKKSNIFYVFLILLPVCIYFYLVFKFSVNMPWWDDYGAILGFVNNFLTHKNDIGYLFNIFFKDHNEHRIVFDRLIALLDYFLFGSINFILLDFIGNLGLLGIFLLVMYLAFKNKLSMKELIPISFFMFSLSQFGLVTWAMASIQQFWQLFFSLMSIYFLTKDEDLKPKNISYSLLFAVIASFTGGGGLINFIVGFLYIAFYKKHKTYTFVWTLFSAFMYLFYFVVLKYALQRQYAQSISSHSINSIIYSINHPKAIIEYILTFLVGINGGWILSVSLLYGFIILMLSLYIIFKSPGSTISLMISFILFTAVVASFFRMVPGEIRMAAPTRYAEYPNLLFSLIYIWFMSNLREATKRMFYWFSLSIGVFLFSLWLIIGSIILQYRNNMAKTGIACLGGKKFCINTLEESIKLHTFNPPLDLNKISKNTYDLNIVDKQIRLHLINTIKQKLKNFI